MKQDEQKTDVIFRMCVNKFSKEQDDLNRCIAIFPYTGDYKIDGYVMCYQHVWQHYSAHYDWVMQYTVPAQPEQFEPLKKELEQWYGYNFRIMQRMNKQRMCNS